MNITPANLQKYHLHVPQNYDSDIDGYLQDCSIPIIWTIENTSQLK